MKSLKNVLTKFPTSLLQIDRLQPIMILKPIEMKLLTQPMRNKLVKNRRVTVWKGRLGVIFFKTMFLTISYRVKGPSYI